MEADFDAGEVWDSLNDDTRTAKAAVKLKKAAEVYLLAVNEAVEAMEAVAQKDQEEELLQELDENRYHFIDKLASVQLHESLKDLKQGYLDLEVTMEQEDGRGVDDCGACGKCGSLSPWRCGCNDALARSMS